MSRDCCANGLGTHSTNFDCFVFQPYASFVQVVEIRQIRAVDFLGRRCSPAEKAIIDYILLCVNRFVGNIFWMDVFVRARGPLNGN